MKTFPRIAAMGAVAALALTACAEAPDETTAGGGDASSDLRPCIVSDAGGFDDKSFNQLSYEGIKDAADELGAEMSEVQSDSETDFKNNLESLVSEGCDTIVSVGFALSVDTIESAKANEDINYILMDDAADNDYDGEVDAPNVKPLVYDTAQAAFLAGYLAAGYSETGKVGTFGGMPYPTVTIFMDGFKQGVEHFNEVKGASVEVVGYEGGDQGSFTEGFEANDKAKTTAQLVIDQGVDVILPVGGPIYQSAMDAIEDSGREIALIGTDSDLFEKDPNTEAIVLTSILKGMRLSVSEAVMSAGEGTFDTAPYVGTLENDGVGLAPLHNFEDKVPAELMAEVEQLKADIIAGDLVITSYLSE